MSWSSEEEAKLRALLEKGVSRDEIARMLGRPKSTVTNRVKKLGLANKQNPPEWSREEVAILLSEYDAGATLTSIAQMLGRTNRAVAVKARYFGKTRPRGFATRDMKEDQRTALSMAYAGESLKAIAGKTGRSQGWAWKLIKSRPHLHKRWSSGRYERLAEAISIVHKEGRGYVPVRKAIAETEGGPGHTDGGVAGAGNLPAGGQGQ